MRRATRTLALFASVLAAALVAVLAGAARAQESPWLVVTPERIDVKRDQLTWSALQLTNDGGGTLTWTARVDAQWLRLAGAEGGGAVDRLAGEGEALLQVGTVGRGLVRGTYEGHVLLDGSGGAVTVPVTMAVGIEPALDPSETRVEAAAVPAGAWSSPFAVPVAEVLTRPLSEVAAQLREQSGVAQRDVRVVAVTSRRVLYVAAESQAANQGWDPPTYENRVWTSADGGATWNLLLRREPNVDCSYSNRLQAAALHPDGERVFLGVTDGFFLDDQKVLGPTGLTDVDALHVSADGGYLYVVTEFLPGTCLRPGPTSDHAVYRGRFVEGSDRLRWDGGRSPLVGFLAPVAGIGSDPADPDVVYLRAASGALFRKLLGPAAYGWRRLDAADLPAGLDYATARLASATDFVRVPDSYARASVPDIIDAHNAWAGYLFGRDGVAYAYYTGYHGGMYWDSVIASRDAGVTWSGVWGIQNYGSRPTGFSYLDGRGHVGVDGTGSWLLDPIDPLTSYVYKGTGDIISRTANGGGSWTAVGQGLPGASGAPRVALDSLGTIYARFGSDAYARSVAYHPLRVTDVVVEPSLLQPGDRAVVTARVVGWPPMAARPGLPPPDDVRLQTEPDRTWTDLRDDGVAPDAVAADGLWTVAVTVPEDRPYGFYAAIVAARTTGDVPSRTSARAAYQVVPGGDVTVFTDAAGPGWTCADDAGAAIASAEHVHAGTAALRVDSDVTCSDAGDAMHPFSRTLDLWAYSPTGAGALFVEDARLDSGGLPAGRWVHLALPAEALHARPPFRFDLPQAALVAQLRFRADAPVWLDQVSLRGLVSSVPTAVAEPATPPRPPATVLLPAYPNPFNAATVLRFRLERPGRARLVVLDLLGQLVRTLVDADLPAGTHRITWTGRDDDGSMVGSGVYLCRLVTERAATSVGRILLLR